MAARLMLIQKVKEDQETALIIAINSLDHNKVDLCFHLQIIDLNMLKFEKKNKNKDISTLNPSHHFVPLATFATNTLFVMFE